MRTLDIIDRYKLVRRGLLGWSMGIITFTVWMFFEKFELVEDPQARVIIAIIGILAVSSGFFERQYAKEIESLRD